MRKLVAILLLVYGCLDRLASIHTLPGDLNSFWEQRMPDLGAAGWVLLAIASCAIIYVFWPQVIEVTQSLAQKPENLNQERSVNLNRSVNAGVINTGDINLAPKERTLTRELKDWILSEMPRDLEIMVFSQMGNPESRKFALQIHSFLAANGFPMEKNSPSEHMFFDSPVNDVKVSTLQHGEKKIRTVVVGSIG